MLLSSPIFLFAFLPVTLLVYFLLGRKNHHLAAGSLLVASLFSYLCWDYRFLAIFLAYLCSQSTPKKIVAGWRGAAESWPAWVFQICQFFPGITEQSYRDGNFPVVHSAAHWHLLFHLYPTEPAGRCLSW